MKGQATSEIPDVNEGIANKGWMLRQLIKGQAQIKLAGSSTFLMERARKVNSFTRILSCLLISLFCLASANVAFAQSYASSAGYDGNPCNSALPCRTVDRALATAPSGGNVILMDAGPYEPFIITRTVNVIAAPGASPHIIAQPTGLAAVRIRLPQGEFAYLEGLTISTDKPGGIGVQWVYSSKLLWMKNCVVSGFSMGLQVWAGGRILIDNCTFSSCDAGINMGSVSDPIYATIQYTRVTLAGLAMYFNNIVEVRVDGCEISRCNDGILVEAYEYAYPGGTFTPHITASITNSLIHNNGSGVRGYGNSLALIRLGHNTIYKNLPSGVARAGSVDVCDLGGNSVFANGSLGIPDDDFRTRRVPACPF